MIDFHSHILPGIDDGSRDTQESISLLRLLSEQGITTVVATPHFYANRGSVDEFLSRRDGAFEALMSALPDGESLPQIRCGAEVRYYNGISRMQGLDRLTAVGSELLLIEMPEKRWSEYEVKELAYLSNSGKMRIALAHVERYMGMQKKEVISILHENGLLMQVNAEFINGLFTRRKALSLLRSGRVSLVGSDTHNLTSRAPHIGAAYGLIERKLGRDFLSHLDRRGDALLRK